MRSDQITYVRWCIWKAMRVTSKHDRIELLTDAIVVMRECLTRG